MQLATKAAEAKDVTLEEAWSEVEREIQVRKRIYDDWVKNQKLSWADARDRLARMIKASLLLKRLLDLQPETQAEQVEG